MGGGQPAAVVIVTHNSATHLPATLDALVADPGGVPDVVVVDSGSIDDTAEVARRYPVRFVDLGGNAGFGAGCAAGMAATSAEVVAFLNPDAVPQPGWLGPLAAAVREPGVGAAMATVELAERPRHFNTSGGALHFAGLAWVSDLGEPIPDWEAGLPRVPFPSGAAFAMRRDVWAAIGGMRTDFHIYHEDTDLGWRLAMRGLRTVRAPRARVAHHYEFARNAAKLGRLERNRWLMLLANYRAATLVLLAPALLVVELGVLVVAARDGWAGAKLRAWWEALRMLPGVAEARRRAQAGRTVGDATLLARMDARFAAIPVPEAAPPRSSGAVDRVLAGWLRLVLPLIRRGDRRRGLA